MCDLCNVIQMIVSRRHVFDSTVRLPCKDKTRNGWWVCICLIEYIIADTN